MIKKILLSFLITTLTLTSFTVKENNASLLPTSLKVTVVDVDNNPVEGVLISLFGDENNYRAGTNQLRDPKKTNSKGQVTFKKMNPKPYYIHATKGESSNIGEDVRTNKLQEGRINKVTIMIE